jgi:hypothetical protein
VIVPLPFACDVCGTQQTNPKNWYVALLGIPFVLGPWSQTKALAHGVTHLCSNGCAAIALQRWMDDPTNRDTASLARNEEAKEVSKSALHNRPTPEELHARLGQPGPRWLSGYSDYEEGLGSVPAGVRAPSDVAMQHLQTTYTAPRTIWDAAGTRPSSDKAKN